MHRYPSTWLSWPPELVQNPDSAAEFVRQTRIHSVTEVNEKWVLTESNRRRLLCNEAVRMPQRHAKTGSSACRYVRANTS